MISRLAHVCIFSSDLAATEAFYCGKLGLRRVFDFIKEGRLYGFYLSAGGGTFLEVFAGEAPDTPGRLRHLCFETGDLDEAVRLLDAAGVPHTAKKRGGDQTWQLWLNDPDGLDIELHQYTAESSQRRGTPCLVDW